MLTSEFVPQEERTVHTASCLSKAQGLSKEHPPPRGLPLSAPSLGLACSRHLIHASALGNTGGSYVLLLTVSSVSEVWHEVMPEDD